MQDFKDMKSFECYNPPAELRASKVLGYLKVRYVIRASDQVCGTAEVVIIGERVMGECL